MTRAMTVRLDDDTDKKLAELAMDYPSTSAAVQEAIRQAWIARQYAKMEAAYAAIRQDQPWFPYDSAEEAQAWREHRVSRRQRKRTNE